MARVLVTGCTTGLGLAAAQALLDAGHDVIAHARNLERAAGVGNLAGRATGVVIGDLASHGAVGSDSEDDSIRPNSVLRFRSLSRSAG